MEGHDLVSEQQRTPLHGKTRGQGQSIESCLEESLSGYREACVPFSKHPMLFLQGGYSSNQTLKNADNWLRSSFHWGTQLAVRKVHFVCIIQAQLLTPQPKYLRFKTHTYPYGFYPVLKYLLFLITFYISSTEPQISLGLRLHFIHLVSSRLYLAQCPATNKCLINVYRMKGLQK